MTYIGSKLRTESSDVGVRTVHSVDAVEVSDMVH